MLASNAFAATFTVTTQTGTGPGSLQQAILDANANAGPDEIRFAVSGVDLTAPLSPISGPTAINGTLPGGTKVVISKFFGNEVDCDRLFQFESGSSGSSLTAIETSGFCEDLRIAAAVSNVIVTDSRLRGDAAILGNDNTFIGNSIARVTINGDRNRLLQNEITVFVRLISADDNQIGSATQGNRIRFLGLESSGGTVVEGNTFDPLSGSTNFAAISVSNVQSAVPGPIVIRANTFSGYRRGVSVLPPAAPVFPNPTGITITANSISFAEIPIDLGNNGLTANDPAPDADTGPNNLQNYPVLARAAVGVGQYTVSGSLTSAPLTTYRIELFSGPASFPNPRTFLGGFDVTTDASGVATFTHSGTTGPAAGEVVMATATNLTTGDTSEVSAAVTVESAGLIPTLSPWALLALALTLCVVAYHFSVRI